MLTIFHRVADCSSDELGHLLHLKVTQRRCRCRFQQQPGANSIVTKCTRRLCSRKLPMYLNKFIRTISISVHVVGTASACTSALHGTFTSAEVGVTLLNQSVSITAISAWRKTVVQSPTGTLLAPAPSP